MRKINEMLAVVILSLAAVLLAAIGLRAYDTHVIKRQEEADLARQEKVLSRNREAHDRVSEMRREIEELSRDRERLGQFLDEIRTGAAEAAPVLMLYGGEEDSAYGGMTENAVRTAYESLSGNDAVSENDAEPEGETVSENGMAPERDTVSGNGMTAGDAVSGNSMMAGNATVSGNAMVSENAAISGNDTISENTGVSENSAVSENASISGNGTVSGDMLGLLQELVSPEITLEERRQKRSSLQETLLTNFEDRAYLENTQLHFSDKKIACLGDSITAAANLEGEAGYQSFAYPALLKELLGAEEVYNLGIGGSSIGRYWADAFVERYTQIPPDTDMIIVMGGTNDGFCLSEEEFGTLSERKPWTFCGDLDELMKGLKADYPNARIFFATPLPNILQDYLMRERAYLLPQKRISDVILTLSEEYGFEVLDLYNSNILDSHDADIVADYMPDGVHANKEGYRILAEHIAAEVARSCE